MNVSRSLLSVSVLGAVVAAAVVTGAVVGTVRAVDDGVVAAVPPPRAAPAAPAVPAVPDVPQAAPEPAAGVLRTTRLALGAAGSVLLAADGGTLVVRSVDPAAGWTVDKVDDGGRSVDVRLRNGRAEARAEAVLSDGRVVVTRLRVRER